MNIQSLLNSLYKDINTTTNTTQMLMLAKAVERLNVGAVKSVATFASLPAASLSNEGELYFVVNNQQMYWSTGADWYYLTQPPSSVLWSWGTGANLGDNTSVAKSSPVSVVGGFIDWTDVSLGYRHSVGLRADGTVWAWGCNTCGRLGDNSITNRSSPVSVVGGFTDWSDISAGSCHSLGIRTNGTLWSWGGGGSGQLGDNTAGNKSSPASVIGGFTDWCDISAGFNMSAGVRTTGTLWTWGSGAGGTLGDNTVANKSSPVQVSGGFTDWCQVSVGTGHAIAVRTNGTAWAWGFGICGKIGDGTVTNRSSPVQVCGAFTNWCQVSASMGLHSLGVRSNGTIWAWGSNTWGQLGDGTAVNKSSPVQVAGGFTDWCAVSAGYCHSLGLRTNGTAWAWGSNINGSLGDSTVTSKSSPVQVAGGFTDWCRISAGCTFSSGLRVTSI